MWFDFLCSNQGMAHKRGCDDNTMPIDIQNKAFEERGYSAHYRVVSSKEFGLSQSRTRCWATYILQKEIDRRQCSSGNKLKFLFCTLVLITSAYRFSFAHLFGFRSDFAHFVVRWFIVDPVTLRSPLDMLDHVYCAPLPLQKVLNPGASLEEDTLAPTSHRRTVDGRKGDKWKTGFSKYSREVGEAPQLATVFLLVALGAGWNVCHLRCFFNLGPNSQEARLM